MISCNQYDYIEIVCMHQYPIKLTLKSGEAIQGIALDTQRNDRRDECIKMSIDGVEQLVILEQIKNLEIMVENPHLKEVSFE